MTRLSERFSLSGKTAVITGASRGLGVTLCDVLSQAGADIVAVARDEALLAETQAIVTENGRRCLSIAADLVLYLASPASGMVNGQEIFVDGGYTAL